MSQTNIVLLAVVCALVTTAGQIALKIGVSSPSLGRHLASGQAIDFLVAAAATPMVWAGFVLYVLSAALWLVILARAELSYVFPLVSLGFVFTAIYGYFAMDENLSLMRMAGIGLIVIGVACVAKS